MNEKYTVDILTLNSVSIKKESFFTVDGKEYPLGEPHRKAYVNSESGRAELTAEVPEPYLSAVMAVWGEEPTVSDEPNITPV